MHSSLFYISKKKSKKKKHSDSDVCRQKPNVDLEKVDEKSRPPPPTNLTDEHPRQLPQHPVAGGPIGCGVAELLPHIEQRGEEGEGEGSARGGVAIAERPWG